MSGFAPITFSLDKIDQVAAAFWQAARQFRHIVFSGGLGAGKTTFIHALCDHLGVADAVSSPTFALINEYHFSDGGATQVIYHMDWYRLRNEEEAAMAGMEDCLLQANAWCFVEWPERAPALLQSPYLWVSISAGGPDSRTITCTPH